MYTLNKRKVNNDIYVYSKLVNTCSNIKTNLFDLTNTNFRIITLILINFFLYLLILTFLIYYYLNTATFYYFINLVIKV